MTSKPTGTSAAARYLAKATAEITAYRMADDGDRLRVAAVIADCLIGDRGPHQMGTDIRRDTGAVDALRQFVQVPINHGDQPAEQIGASARFGRLLSCTA